MFLEALTAGERNPASLADLAKGRLRVKTEQLRAAFEGSFTTPHGNLTQLHLDRIDLLNAHIQTLTGLFGALINERSLGWARDLLATITGISETGAENILAESRLTQNQDTPAPVTVAGRPPTPTHYRIFASVRAEAVSGDRDRSL